jgi:hydrogenase maturation factor HypF (carbamoyltransferase family)
MTHKLSVWNDGAVWGGRMLVVGCFKVRRGMLLYSDVAGGGDATCRPTTVT